MQESKVPRKGNFNIPDEKDFFASVKSSVPRKPEIPQKPETPNEEISPRRTVASSQPFVPKKDDGKTADAKPVSEKPKPFENISEGLVPLRTYRQDVAGVLRDKKTSLVQMVLEEQKERNRREQQTSPTSRKNLPLILLSVLFLFSTAGIIYYIYFRMNPVDHTLEELHVSPLIFVEKNKEISIDGKDALAVKGEIINAVQDTERRVDVIEYLFFTETLNSQTKNGAIQQKNLISANRFFETLGIKIPPALLRSLRTDFMLGTHSFNKNQPFFVLKTDYYDNAFAGMLEWENKLAQDLLPLFDRAGRVQELSQRKWGDTVIKNKDTRTLSNFDGSIALVYVFKDQYTLIITTSEDTLLEVSHRLDLVKEKRPE
jgi:hypothetical protein